MQACIGAYRHVCVCVCMCACHKPPMLRKKIQVTKSGWPKIYVMKIPAWKSRDENFRMQKCNLGNVLSCKFNKIFVSHVYSSKYIYTHTHVYTYTYRHGCRSQRFRKKWTVQKKNVGVFNLFSIEICIEIQLKTLDIWVYVYMRRHFTAVALCWIFRPRANQSLWANLVL